MMHTETKTKKKHMILFLIFSTDLQMGLSQQNQYEYVKFESYYRKFHVSLTQQTEKLQR